MIIELWRLLKWELLASPWVIVVIPVLALLRWALISRSRWIAAIRSGILGLGARSPEITPVPALPDEPEINVAAPHGVAFQPGVAPQPAPVRADPAEFRRRWLLELVESALWALLLIYLFVRPFVIQAFYVPSPSMVETLQINDRLAVSRVPYYFHPPHRGDIVVFQPPSRATEDHASDDAAAATDPWVKRVIGTPGDRIAIRNNHLYRNGVRQEEPYVALLDPFTDKGGMNHVSTGEYSYSFPDPVEMSVPVGHNAYVSLAEGASVQNRNYAVNPTKDSQPHAANDYLFFLRNDKHEGLEVVVPPGKLFVMGDNRNDSDDSHYWGYLDERRVLGQTLAIFWPFSNARLLTDSGVRAAS